MPYRLKSRFVNLNARSRLHHLNVPIIGLTGGVATGKSTISTLLSDKGIPVICADKLIKSIYAEESTTQFIGKEFAAAMKGNEIDFKKLREIAFSNVENKIKLEAFLYEKLPLHFWQAYKALKRPSYVIYDVPLLFEKEINKKVDQSILIYAPKATQIERVIKRDGISKELAEKMLAEQIDIEKKRLMATYVFENITTPQDVFKKILDLLF